MNPVTAFVIAYATAVGLVIGSFLNVVIYRVPNGLSVVSPRSACPRCGHAIAWHENIPVASWLMLRGRCSQCREPISVRYPLVEVGTGALFALTAWRFADDLWALPAWLLFAALAVALSGIDIDTLRLPNPLVLTLYLAGAPLLAAAAVLGDGGTPAIVRAGIGLVASLTFHLAAWLIYPRGMGFGDVKLSGAIGMYLAWLGWGPLAVGLFASYVFGLLASLPAIARHRARPVGASIPAEHGGTTFGSSAVVPFGPSMFAGAALAVAAGQPVWDGYLALVGLA